MLMVTEGRLSRLIRRKFNHCVPYWTMENILDEIIEECKRIDSNQEEATERDRELSQGVSRRV